MVDNNGYVVPEANNLVQLTVEGSGTLKGFDNGNPGDSTSMKSIRRKTFNGLALAVIQSGKKPGHILVRAVSPALRILGPRCLAAMAIAHRSARFPSDGPPDARRAGRLFRQRHVPRCFGHPHGQHDALFLGWRNGGIAVGNTCG